MIQKARRLKVHFIGIGGIGMSAIAEILINYGHEISGSDLSENYNVQKLRKMGANIFLGHQAENIQKVDVVVFSSAVDMNNPEIVYAKEQNIPVLKRSEMLSDLMKLKRGLTIGGTHGKTTTSSMVATILEHNNYEPSYIIGGIVKNLNGHAKAGNGEYLVIEADESDGTFLSLNPIMAVATNIDNDHLDYYGSEKALEEAFLKYLNNIPFYGISIMNGDDEQLFSFRKLMKKPFSYYGLSKERQDEYTYFATDIKTLTSGTKYNLHVHGEVLPVFLKVFGDHNVSNSLAAIALCHNLGVSLKSCIKGIEDFQGVGRRLDIIGTFNKSIVFDDYAHHPTEIAATISALKKMYPQKSIKLIYEPHRYSRTKSCWANYLHCFNGVDNLYLMPIYPASESPIDGISSEYLISDINRLHPGLSQALSGYEDLLQLITSLVTEESVVVAMGAGSIGKKAREILEGL